MKQTIMVGIGGLIGSIARYKLGGAILHHTSNWKFPLSTLLINVLGCFCIGALAGLIERHDAFSPGARLFLITGVLGGFTTFSAFGYEAVFLLRRGESAAAIGYIACSVLLGLTAVWLALRLTLLLAAKH